MTFQNVRVRLLCGTVALGLLTATPLLPAQAQSGEGDGVTSRLIELLVKRGVLQRDEATALLAEAKSERAKIAKAQPKAPAPVAAAPRSPGAASPPPVAVAAALTKPADENVPPGTVRVTYVPQVVRDQIAQQVRNELQQSGQIPAARKESDGLALSDRVRLFGDIRLRGEWDLLPSSNAPQFVDFAAINNGAPYDVTGQSGPPPLLNTTSNRFRERLRARAGIDVDITGEIMAEVAVATGNDASPVSANQTLGQYGPFTKYSIWLDRAYVRATPADWFTAYAGRMPNPFWTTDLMYADTLNFDGVAGTLTGKYDRHLSGILTAGAFPVFNTAFNFGSTSATGSYSSRNAWLFAAQGIVDWKIDNDVSMRFATGYFSYVNTDGKMSSPCTIIYSVDTCDTDNTRALFPGNGNTMMAVRNLALPTPTSPQPQYFGLASPFQILDLHGRVTLDYFKPISIFIEGEFAMNLGFNRNRAIALGVNNFGSNNQPDPGNKAWMVKVTVGNPVITKRWDWNAWIAYKYIETDAVLASLNDSDFHLGGTNAKGFILAGSLGIARNTWLTARWLSSTQISGAPYTADVIQADINVKF